MPVSWLVAGSLGAANIMVLCPNHHRQAHYGQFAITQGDGSFWAVTVDEIELLIPRTKLGAGVTIQTLRVAAP